MIDHGNDDSPQTDSLSPYSDALLSLFERTLEPLQYSQQFLLLLQELGHGSHGPHVIFPTEIIRHGASMRSRSWASRPTGVRKRGREKEEHPREPKPFTQ